MKETEISAYVREAIENQKQGKELKITSNKTYEMPIELKNELAANKTANTAFYKLSFGKQKEYALYIAEAKQNATKLKRIEKIKPLIIRGVGLHDKYKNC